MAALLLLLALKPVRRGMSVGGLNAPFSQDGFERVAAWKSTEAMERFIRRVVQEDLQGKVTEPRELRKWAARSFHYGEPRLSFKELREGLKKEAWTGTTRGEVVPEALVLVDAVRRAVVKKVDPVKGVTVKYDEDGTTEVIEHERVSMRARLLPSLPAFLVRGNLETQIRMFEHKVGKLKKVLLRPIGFLQKVVTWEKPCTALCIVLLLATISASEAMLQVGTWHDVGEENRHFAMDVANFIMYWVQFGVHWLFFIIGVVILISQARWFLPIRSGIKVTKRLCCMFRRAPRNWAFYRPADGPMPGSSGRSLTPRGTNPSSRSLPR
jgi:hypothetical protein